MPRRYKLVRDKVPKTIIDGGGSPRYRVAGEEEYIRRLRRKAIEEAEEMQESDEEVADLLEVCYSFAEAIGMSRSALERSRAQKASRMGRFKRRYVLDLGRVSGGNATASRTRPG